MTCTECGAGLIRTSERYCCCPNGHGKLRNATTSGFQGFNGNRDRSEQARPATLFSLHVKAYDRGRKKFARQPSGDAQQAA